MIITIVNLIFTFFQIVLFARIIFSWIRVDPYHPVWGPVQRFVFDATEPLLAPIRRMMPQTGMFDFSILILWLLLGVTQSIVMRILL
ncbi:MAG: YggT family protein [Chloroflexi bacterium]|nr:YggT family protein [Chloroflexota bacterium]